MVKFLSNRRNGREVDGKDSFPEPRLVPEREENFRRRNRIHAASFDETLISVWVMP
jgi:hypothetical protein